MGMNVSFAPDETIRTQRRALIRAELKWQEAFARLGVKPRNPATGEVEFARRLDEGKSPGLTQEQRRASREGMLRGDRQIADMIRAGMTSKEIQIEAGAGWQRISRVAAIFGLKISRDIRGKYVDPAEIERLRELASQGLTALQIKDVTGWHVATVYNRAASAGIRVRCKGYEHVWT